MADVIVNVTVLLVLNVIQVLAASLQQMTLAEDIAFKNKGLNSVIGFDVHKNTTTPLECAYICLQSDCEVFFYNRHQQTCIPTARAISPGATAVQKGYIFFRRSDLNSTALTEGMTQTNPISTASRAQVTQTYPISTASTAPMGPTDSGIVEDNEAGLNPPEAARPAGCPHIFTYIGDDNFCYRLFNESKTNVEATDVCAAYGHNVYPAYLDYEKFQRIKKDVDGTEISKYFRVLGKYVSDNEWQFQPNVKKTMHNVKNVQECQPGYCLHANFSTLYEFFGDSCFSAYPFICEIDSVDLQ